MAKKIILIRHAKSSWDYQVSDRDRPLKERGIRDAHMVSKYLKENLKKPDAVFSSPANRALHTCMIFMRNLGFPTDMVTITDELYDFGGNDVVNFISSLDNALSTVILFGHNHAFTAIANSLGDKYIENVTTSGVVVLNFQTDKWAKLATGANELTLFPRNLK